MEDASLSPRSSSVSHNSVAYIASTARPQTSRPQLQHDTFTGPSQGHLLRRGNSDSVPISSSNLIGSNNASSRNDPLMPASGNLAPRFPGGETWRDFLRETAGTASNATILEPHPHPYRGSVGTPEHSRGMDGLSRAQSYAYTMSTTRKRVPSSSAEESSGKRRPPSGSTSSTPGMGQGTSTDPIDLTSPGRERRVPRPSDAQRQGSTGSIVLPPWQADEEVSQCPVCGTPFTLWYRRHHCRKCGRVVCGTCSPHRITIPRQFIVQPPPSTDSSHFLRLSSSPEEPRSNTSVPDPQNPATRVSISRRSSATMSGGEVVRVCNPCVPDPNFSLPPQVPQSQSYFPVPSVSGFALPSSALSTFSTGISQRPPQIPERNSSAWAPAVPGLSRSYAQQPSLGQGGPALSNSTGAVFLPSNPTAPPSLNQFPANLMQMRPASLASSTAGPSNSNMPNSLTPSSGIASAHRQYYAANAAHAAAVASRPLSYRPASTTNGATTLAPPQYPPRRQVKEEDECPVCGRELPPRGQGGDESVREQHIDECIRLYSASSSSAPAPPPPAPPSTTPNLPIGGPAVARAGSLASGNEPVPTAVMTAASPSALLPPPLRPSQHRMLVYHATEKDCVGEDGEAQECVICFEEFEEGDEMGRLDCLCKFHRACIRQWWNTKGVGSCPTHQLHS